MNSYDTEDKIVMVASFLAAIFLAVACYLDWL